MLLPAHGCLVGARAGANPLVTEVSGTKRSHECPDQAEALMPSAEGIWVRNKRSQLEKIRHVAENGTLTGW